MLNKYMKCKLQDPQNELESIYEDILRTDFQIQLSIPRSDPDGQFYSLVQCLEILNKSKQKYIKKLESELKQLEYDDETYRDLSFTMEEGKESGLDGSKKRTRKLIDSILLQHVLKLTNNSDLERSETENGGDFYGEISTLDARGRTIIHPASKTPTKEMLSRASLIPKKKSNESKISFEKRVRKELSSRYQNGAPFSQTGQPYRSELIYFQGKFIPLFFSMSQFPLHAESMELANDLEDFSLDRSWDLGPMLTVLGMKTLEVHAQLSQEYFDENKMVYQKIDSLLQTYQHNGININHSISLVKKLVLDFDERVDIKSLLGEKRRLLPTAESLWPDGVMHEGKKNYASLSSVNMWVKPNPAFHDLDANGNIWAVLDNDLRDHHQENLEGLPLLSEFLFSSFNSFSDGFGGNSQHNKIKAADKLAINIMRRLKDHLADLKKPSEVQAWLQAELVNYYTKSFTQDGNKKRNFIDFFETLSDEYLKLSCIELVHSFTEDEDMINKNLKKFFKFCLRLEPMNIGIGEKSHKRQEWIQKNIPKHHLRYLSGFYPFNEFKGIDDDDWVKRAFLPGIEFTNDFSGFKALVEISNKINKLPEKSEDIKEDLSPEEYSALRKHLMTARQEHLLLEDRFLSVNNRNRKLKTLNKSVVPRIDMVPEELFVLKKTYKKSFDQDTVKMITEALQIIEQNPAVGIKLLRLIEKEIVTFLDSQGGFHSMGNKFVLSASLPTIQEEIGPSEAELQCWIQVGRFINGKIDSMIDTHTYSLADSLSRILLIFNGVCPYKDSEGNDTYKKIINELKGLITFFERYTEGLINVIPSIDRPVNQKLLTWEIINNLKAIEKYFLTLEYAQIDVKNELGIPAPNNDFSLEQIFSISKKKEVRRVLDKKSMASCLQSELFEKKKDYQKYNYIQKELGKKKSALKRSQKKLFLERSSAIHWLKTRPGNARYKSLRYGDWKEDVGYYHFSLTHLNAR